MYDKHDSKGPGIFGLIAEYDDPDALLAAAKTAYSEGYRDLEAYSPFPVHGLSEAIGFHKTILPVFTLIAGLTGAAGAFGMQWFASVVHYPYDVGGRPYFSWPMWIPITFEGMVLVAAFTTGIAMILMNGLPMPYHPVFNAKNFDRATSTHDQTIDRAGAETTWPLGIEFSIRPLRSPSGHKETFAEAACDVRC